MTGWFALSHAMFVIAFVAGLLTLGTLLRQRRSPQSALAWIGFAIVVPYVAVPLFFLLGWRKLRPLVRLPEQPATNPDAPLQTLLTSYGVPPTRAGNRLRLCVTGERAHAALVDLIENARECIDFEIFILHPDAEGKDVLKRLERRASEGLAVRLLLDGFGSLTTWPWALRSLSRAGAQVAFFHPLLRPSWWFRANLRNHRKIIIADHSRVLAGGINIAKEYLGPRPDPTRWTDLAFLAEGPIAADYQSVLDADWAYATGTPRASRGESLGSLGDAQLQLVRSGPDDSEDALQAALLQSIYGARDRIWIVTPYFVPDAEILQALALAARRGVEVRLIVPASSNHRFADWARGPYLRDLERQGARVLRFQRGMLHAKAVLVDGVAMLGSANFDLRSLYLDFEVVMIVFDDESVRDVEAWIQGLSEETAETDPAVSRVQEIFEGAVRLLAPLL